MSRKIIGVTVGTTLPKPDFEQTDPTKGDYIKNKPDVEGLKNQVNVVGALVGDTKVSTQIEDAIASKSDVGHNHDEDYDAKGAADTALASARTYADQVKNDLLNGAGAAYDTLKELGDLIDENQDAIDALEKIAANKANSSDLTSHTNDKSNPHGVTAAQVGAPTKDELSAVSALVGDTKVSTQISDAISKIDFPVDSVNGKTGDVTLTASDINGFIDWFGAGQPISANADLNTYTTPGKYYVPNKATAATIANTPSIGEGYVLFVFSRTYASHVTQMAITNPGVLYIRCASSGGAFDAWSEKISRSSVESLIDTITATDVGAVPTSRTINGKALSGDITLSVSDVGAVAVSEFAALQDLVGDTKVSSQISSAINGIVHPVTSVNNKTGVVTLNADDVGARPDTWVPSISDIDGLVDWFGQGVAIPENADLDTYTTPGKYYVNNKALASTIANTPTTGEGYVLFVFSRTYASYYTQLAITNPGDLYIRCASSGAVFGEWSYKPSLSAVESLIEAITAEDVGADVSGAASSALTSAKAYTDEQIGAFVGDKAVATQITSAIDAIDYPVDSVNSKTGAVVLSASDVGARPDTWVPTASDVGALALTAIRKTFAQVDANGNTISTAVSAYPTEPGVYKVTTAFDGLPTGCGNYGNLLIFNCGGYHAHVYMNRTKNVYTTRTTGSNAYTVTVPASDSWNLHYTTGNKPTAEDIGAASSSHNHAGTLINPKCLELGSGASDHGGYIDFHYNDSSEDYTSRIIESSSGLLSILSGLVLDSNAYGTTLPAAGTAGRIFFKKL